MVASQKPLGKVAVLTCALGGTGKSSMAILLAAELAKTKSVCIIDLDIYDAQLGYFLPRAEASELKVDSQSPVADTINANLVHSTSTGVHALLVTKEETTEAYYREAIPALQEVFDVLILDSAPYRGIQEIANLSLQAADKIYAITIPSVAGLNTTKTLLTHIAETASPDKFRVVINKTFPDGTRTPPSELDGTPVITAIPFTSHIRDAHSVESLTDALHQHDVKESYQAIARDILSD